MTYDPRRHHRRSTRLKGWNYSAPGAYFVTLCVQNREARFGKVIDGSLHLNTAGHMVVATWHALPVRFSNVVLDEFVVMPNHVHGLIILRDVSDTGLHSMGAPAAPTPGQPAPMTPHPGLVGAPLVSAPFAHQFTHPSPGDAEPARPPAVPIPAAPLGDIIGAFKSISTDEYIRGVHELNWPPFVKRVWQRGFHDHIARDERELNAIRRYIHNNPRQWTLDRDNRANIRRLPPPGSAADYLADLSIEAP